MTINDHCIEIIIALFYSSPLCALDRKLKGQYFFRCLPATITTATFLQFQSQCLGFSNRRRRGQPCRHQPLPAPQPEASPPPLLQLCQHQLGHRQQDQQMHLLQRLREAWWCLDPRGPSRRVQASSPQLCFHLPWWPCWVSRPEINRHQLWV